MNADRLRINFFFRWFRFSLRMRATAALTWAEGEHTWAEGEPRVSRAWAEPEQRLSILSILSMPWVSLRIAAEPVLLAYSPVTSRDS